MHAAGVDEGFMTEALGNLEPWLCRSCEALRLEWTKISQSFRDGMTALHLAAHEVNLEVVNLLLAAGTDQNLPLDRALIHSHHEIMNLFKSEHRAPKRQKVARSAD